MQSEILKTTIADLQQRMDELRPKYEEYLQLAEAAKALERVAAKPVADLGSAKSGRKKSSVPTRERIFNLALEKPGIGVTELSDSLGVTRGMIFKALNELEKQNRIERRIPDEGKRKLSIYAITPEE